MSEEAPTIDEIARRMLRKGDVAGFVIDWMRAPITKEKLVAGMRRTIETACARGRCVGCATTSRTRERWRRCGRCATTRCWRCG